MKNLLFATIVAAGMVGAVEAAPEGAVSQSDLKALIERIEKLEAENKAQAAKIAQLEGAKAPAVSAETGKVIVEEGASVSDSGRVVTATNGKKYYLADKMAGIFEPLSESGLQITPYGYLVFEGVYADRALDFDWTTDFVKAKNDPGYRNQNSTLSMQDSILGVQFATVEPLNGWTFSGKAEFDLAGGNTGDADDYDLHWRHLYVDAAHESGWSILFGQTWHLWKMVSPSEIDGAWMENAGHPYRRSPQIRVTKKWDWEDNGALEWRVGFVKNGPNASTERDDDGMLDSSATAWGWFETAAIYKHEAAWDEGRKWLFGIGGMYGRDRSRRWDGEEWLGDGDDYNSQMLMFAGSVPFLKKFTLTGQIYGGENLGRVQGGCAQSVAFDDDVNSKGREIPTVGGFVELAYELNDDWDFAAGYGFDDPRINRRYVAGKSNYGIDFNERAYIDVFYHITSNFKLGLEYAHLQTDYKGVGTSAANRIQFSAFYDF